MKKIFVLFAFILALILPANANVMPYYTNSINTNSIGVYQATNSIVVRKEPNDIAPLLFAINWNDTSYNCDKISASNLFAVYMPKRNLAFLTVVDESDNEDWVQISFNQNGYKTGWVKKDDDFRFMNWRTFFNLYGRKYGLYYMKDAPEDSKTIYGSSADNSQQIGKITYPQNVKLTAVKGNWMLINAYDVDRMEKIGWIKWRNTNGEIYLFPDIK